MYRERVCVCVSLTASLTGLHTPRFAQRPANIDSYYDKYYTNIHKHDQTKRSPLELFGAAG